MKKLVLLLLLFLLPLVVEAKEVDIYLFYGKECSHCYKEKEYLRTLKKQYKENVAIHKYEVWHNKENAKLLTKVKKSLNDKGEGVPYTVIGSESITGYSDKAKSEIKNLVDKNLVNTKGNTAFNILNNQKTSNKTLENEELFLPIIGNTNVKEMPLILSTFLLAVGTVLSLNGLWLVLLLAVIFPKTNKKSLTVLFFTAVSLVYSLFIFDIIKLNSIMQMIIKTVISIIPIIIFTARLNKMLKQENKEGKGFSKPIIYIGMLLIGLISGFILYNFDGLPSILSVILDINKVNNNLYYILYILFYAVISVFLTLIIYKIIKKLPHNSIINLIILALLSITLIFFPNLFIFAS